MPILTHPAFGPKVAIAYISAGGLISLWTAVWYFTLGRDEGDLSTYTQFWLWGLFLSGLGMIMLGLLLGRIGRSARQVEMPPSEAVNAEASIQATAAANPPPVVAPGAPPNVETPTQPSTRVAPTPAAKQPATAAPQQYVPGVMRR
jgi:hypothetical protein